MGRCKKQRHISEHIICNFFAPVWIGIKNISEVELMMDEVEALSLADIHGMCMKMAAVKMSVSAPTFCRILASARKKVSTAIILGYSLKICPCSQKSIV